MHCLSYAVKESDVVTRRVPAVYRTAITPPELPMAAE